MSSWTVDTADLIANMDATMGRPVPALRAVLMILENNLVPVLVAKGFHERAHPKSWHFAGEDLGDTANPASWPKVLVGGAISTEEFGMGHMDAVSINVTCAISTKVSRREFLDVVDVAAVARGILRYPTYSGRFVDPDDATIAYWNHLEPIGFAAVPEQWPQYSGYMARFVARQVPGSNLWDVPLSQD